jgi:cellulose biosynthesis protein BcsQ
MPLSAQAGCSPKGDRVTRIIAVANQKGGVAKTTTVASLGVALAELGNKVLLVDLDPQACLTFSLGVDPDGLELSIHDVLMGRVGTAMAVQPTADAVDLLPSHIDLTGSEVILYDRPAREHVLRKALQDVSQAYDYVLIDCSPSRTWGYLFSSSSLSHIGIAKAAVLPLPVCDFTMMSVFLNTKGMTFS